MAFSERLAQAMCRQLRMVGFAHPDSEDAAADFPIKLPPNAAIAASHHAEWPHNLPAALGKLRMQPLRVYYVRIERKARPDKILAYFRRQLPSAARHVTEHGVWVNDFSTEKRKGHLRSVNVFISKPNKDADMPLDQEQQVIVDLLAVEALPPQ